MLSQRNRTPHRIGLIKFNEIWHNVCTRIMPTFSKMTCGFKAFLSFSIYLHVSDIKCFNILKCLNLALIAYCFLPFHQLISFLSLSLIYFCLCLLNLTTRIFFNVPHSKVRRVCLLPLTLVTNFITILFTGEHASSFLLLFNVSMTTHMEINKT